MFWPEEFHFPHKFLAVSVDTDIMAAKVSRQNYKVNSEIVYSFTDIDLG